MILVIRKYIVWGVILLSVGIAAFFIGRFTTPVSNPTSVRGSLNYVGSNLGSSYILLQKSPLSVTAKEVAIRRISRSIGALRILAPVLSRVDSSQTQNIGGTIIALRSLVAQLTVSKSPQNQANWGFLRTKILRVLFNNIRNNQSEKNNMVFIREFSQTFAQLHKDWGGSFQP